MMIKTGFRHLEQIKNILASSHSRLSVAESVTVGFLQFACGQMENAKDVFAGGITAYTLDEKVRLLGVDAIEAKKCDCVSPAITAQMAIAASKLFHTNWSIATTGYATPVPESQGEIFAFYSIAYQDQILHTDKVELATTTDAKDAQYIFTAKALEAFYEILKKQLSLDK